MRYNNITTLEFVDVDGRKFAVKDIRPIEELTTAIVIRVLDGMMLDELASRDDVFGTDQEGQTYKILDNNIVKMTEQDFELAELDKVRIPNL